jgi:hypothetical protein
MQSMMIDIMTYGPLTVAIDLFVNFYQFNPVTEVYNQSSGSYVGGHAVKVVGWGVTSGGMPYWIVANSWNTWWGNQGYFMFLRGANLCGIESHATSVYTSSRPNVAARIVEERESDAEVVNFSAPVTPPGGFVEHLDLESDFIVNAGGAAANLIDQLNSRRRQVSVTPIVQSASTSVAAGINFDMTMVLDGSIYRILMFQDLQGTYSFNSPPQVIGTVAGSGGLTGGDIAAIVVCSVFGFALAVAAGVYLMTRGSVEGGNDGDEGAAEVGDSRKWKGIPVLNHFSHIRRVRQKEHQSVTARSEPQ